MSKKTTLEEAYFHISNSGITFKIVECENHRKVDIHAPYVYGESALKCQERLNTVLRTEVRTNRNWYFEVKLASFGAATMFRFPLGNPLFIMWMRQALQRTLDRMMTETEGPTDGFEYPFRETTHASIKHEAGISRDYDWPCAPARSSVNQEDKTTGDSQEEYSKPRPPPLTEDQRRRAYSIVWQGIVREYG